MRTSRRSPSSRRSRPTRRRSPGCCQARAGRAWDAVERVGVDRAHGAVRLDLPRRRAVGPDGKNGGRRRRLEDAAEADARRQPGIRAVGLVEEVETGRGRGAVAHDADPERRRRPRVRVAEVLGRRRRPCRLIVRRGGDDGRIVDVVALLVAKEVEVEVLARHGPASHFRCAQPCLARRQIDEVLGRARRSRGGQVRSSRACTGLPVGLSARRRPRSPRGSRWRVRRRRSRRACRRPPLPSPRLVLIHRRRA